MLQNTASRLEENAAFVEIYVNDQLKTFQKVSVNVAVSIQSEILWNGYRTQSYFKWI